MLIMKQKKKKTLLPEKKKGSKNLSKDENTHETKKEVISSKKTEVYADIHNYERKEKKKEVQNEGRRCEKEKKKQGIFFLSPSSHRTRNKAVAFDWREE